MVEVAERAVEAAWKVRNLEDFDRRLARAARALDERSGADNLAAMIVYETALTKSGRPREEVRDMVRSFRETFEDDEEPLTIAHASGIMNVEGDDWFFGDGDFRVLRQSPSRPSGTLFGISRGFFVATVSSAWSSWISATSTGSSNRPCVSSISPAS